MRGDSTWLPDCKAVGDRMMRVLFGFVIFVMGNAVAQGEDANLER